MANLITGLKYQPLHQEIKTEQELLQVFADLKKEYSKLNQSFEMHTPRGESIESFEHFLQHSVQEESSLVLNGSGDIGGIVVQDAFLEYDLSSLGDLTKFWDIYRDGSCHSCLNQVRVKSMDPHWACNEGKYGRKNCPDQDSYIKNSEGKPARELAELIQEASE